MKVALVWKRKNPKKVYMLYAYIEGKVPECAEATCVKKW